MGGCRVRHLGFGFRQKSVLLGPYTVFVRVGLYPGSSSRVNLFQVKEVQGSGV